MTINMDKTKVRIRIRALDFIFEPPRYKFYRAALPDLELMRSVSRHSTGGLALKMEKIILVKRAM
jgi:hypothetical protein